MLSVANNVGITSASAGHSCTALSHANYHGTIEPMQPSVRRHRHSRADPPKEVCKGAKVVLVFNLTGNRMQASVDHQPPAGDPTIHDVPAESKAGTGPSMSQSTQDQAIPLPRYTINSAAANSLHNHLTVEAPQSTTVIWHRFMEMS